MAWELYQGAGRARMGVFLSFASSTTGVVEVPKKFLKNDIVNVIN
jgi:hypothetical protein